MIEVEMDGLTWFADIYFEVDGVHYDGLSLRHGVSEQRLMFELLDDWHDDNERCHRGCTRRSFRWMPDDPIYRPSDTPPARAGQSTPHPIHTGRSA